MQNGLNNLIVIAGPTASGKTSLSIQLAQKLKCPIISADSRQVYKELNIGVARPTTMELSLAEHYFIANCSIKEPINAGLYASQVVELLEKLFKTHENIILCGGTGLYIKAVIQGLDETPNSSSIIRKELQTLFEKEGIESLQKILLKIDPKYYLKSEINNPQRLIRAIEIVKMSGKSNLDFRKNKKEKRNFSTQTFCIDIERELLYERINQRVDDMIENGLEAEVKGLLIYKDLEPLNTVGYKEFFEYFEGRLDYESCIKLIKQNTRRYAKRQVTWFKNQGDFTFLSAKEILNKF